MKVTRILKAVGRGAGKVARTGLGATSGFMSAADEVLGSGGLFPELGPMFQNERNFAKDLQGALNPAETHTAGAIWTAVKKKAGVASKMSNPEPSKNEKLASKVKKSLDKDGLPVNEINVQNALEEILKKDGMLPSADLVDTIYNMVLRKGKGK